MFYIAAEEGFPIVPVAIYYEDDNLSWVGDESIGANFFRNFGRFSTTAHISFGEPIVVNEPELAIEEVKEWIEHEVIRLRSLR
jgi:1-acyl-sn-glycerol-3-phosphate acyltransferase